MAKTERYRIEYKINSPLTFDGEGFNPMDAKERFLHSPDCYGKDIEIISITPFQLFEADFKCTVFYTTQVLAPDAATARHMIENNNYDDSEEYDASANTVIRLEPVTDEEEEEEN